MPQLGIGRDDSSLPSIEHLTVAQATQDLAKGTYTSVALVRCYLKRIDEVNDELRPVLEVNHRALDDAATIDAARAAGHNLGPLAGLPILIKGNIGIARETDKDLQTHAGSFALMGSVPPGDATIVSRLRSAGAIILGTTNLSQWGNFRSDNSSCGWSAVGGQTLGAYYKNKDPGGSSAGSAVAADLALSLLTIGTETCGSILAPTAVRHVGSTTLKRQISGIVGIKPTTGLVSRWGCVPLSSTQDTIGPMTRTVADGAAVLSVIAGRDEADSATIDIPFSRPPDYIGACRLDALQGARIGVAWNHIAYKKIEPGSPALAVFEAALDTLRSLGATIVNADYPDLDAMTSSEPSCDIVQQADFVHDIAEYLSRLKINPSGVKMLEDIRRFTQHDPREQYPDRDTAIWDLCLDRSRPLKGSADYQRHLDACRYAGSQATIVGALDQHACDALIMPSNVSDYASPVIAVVAGALPADVAVTMNTRGNLVHRAPGVPLAVSFVGRRFSEETLIGFAYAFEQATQARKGLKHAEGVKVPTTQLGAT